MAEVMVESAGGKDKGGNHQWLHKEMANEPYVKFVTLSIEEQRIITKGLQAENGHIQIFALEKNYSSFCVEIDWRAARVEFQNLGKRCFKI